MDALYKKNSITIFILGALSTVSPFSIDMYLASFPKVAQELHTNEARVSLSVSSYFVGLAIGQIFYGPLLDRFGRKVPLYCGLLIYILASIGCMSVQSVEWLIALRFVQALGGCAAQVAATVMVRDFFPVSQSAKVFSLLMLMIGVSPLLAPSIGSFVSEAFGWRWIFAILAGISALILLLTATCIPAGHKPDKTVSLNPKSICKRYGDVFAVREFRVYALAGAFTFAGLFAYVAGSPIIFFNYFKLTPKQYGLVFAILTGGFIGSNQINIWLHARFGSKAIFKASVYAAFGVAMLLVLGSLSLEANLLLTVGLLFTFLFCVGLTSPNGAALALAPFSNNAGTAAALLGFLNMGIGAAVSSTVGLLGANSSLPVFSIFVISIAIAIGVMMLSKEELIVPADLAPDN